MDYVPRCAVVDSVPLDNLAMAESVSSLRINSTEATSALRISAALPACLSACQCETFETPLLPCALCRACFVSISFGFGFGRGCAVLWQRSQY